MLRFVLILAALLILGLAVVLGFRAYESGESPNIEMPSLVNEGSVLVTLKPIVLKGVDGKGNRVFKNYALDITVKGDRGEYMLQKAGPRVDDLFLRYMLDLMRNSAHSGHYPGARALEARLTRAGQELLGPDVLLSVTVTSITESPAP